MTERVTRLSSGDVNQRPPRPAAIHPTALAGFEREVDAYEHGRPSYPDEAVSWIAERLDLRPGRTVLDLAAGTGKLTRLLAARGAHVIAVEPVAGMRARLAERVPNAVALEGTAEAIPLPDGSVDAATVAQAFHWFRAEEALAELYRVLRPGSGLALIWNVRDLDDPVQAEIDELLREHRHGAPSHEGQRWRPCVEGSPYFGPLEQREFRFVQELDADMLVGRVVSTSYIAVLPPERKREVVDAVRALARRLPAQFPFRYVTKAFLCFRQTDGA